MSEEITVKFKRPEFYFTEHEVSEAEEVGRTYQSLSQTFTGPDGVLYVATERFKREAIARVREMYRITTPKP